MVTQKPRWPKGHRVETPGTGGQEPESSSPHEGQHTCGTEKDPGAEATCHWQGGCRSPPRKDTRSSGARVSQAERPGKGRTVSRLPKTEAKIHLRGCPPVQCASTGLISHAKPDPTTTNHCPTTLQQREQDYRPRIYTALGPAQRSASVKCRPYNSSRPHPQSTATPPSGTRPGQNPVCQRPIVNRRGSLTVPLGYTRTHNTTGLKVSQEMDVTWFPSGSD
jgi:hypothetical protein